MGTKTASMQLSRKLTENFGLPKFQAILNVIKPHTPNFDSWDGGLLKYGSAN